MTDTWKKALIPNLPYILFVYLFDKLCQAVRLAPGIDASEKFLHLSQGFTEAFSSGLPSLHPLDLLVGIAGAVIVRLAVYAKSKNARKYRKGIEYDSARWGTTADIAPYVDPVPDWNIPLNDGGDNESMSISNQKIMLRDFAEKHRMFQYEYYVDDGYTGRNFNRPAFQRMIADIEAGKIGCVVTKDLSRLGRNYIQAGSYIEIFSPNTMYVISPLPTAWTT